MICRPLLHKDRGIFQNKHMLSTQICGRLPVKPAHTSVCVRVCVGAVKLSRVLTFQELMKLHKWI